jgi:hypothetical protein
MASRVLARNIQAIGAVRRRRYNDLVSRLRAAMQDRAELADGYWYSLDFAGITLPEVSGGIAIEQLCCPFPTMRGPDGVKPLLPEELPIREEFPNG